MYGNLGNAFIDVLPCIDAVWRQWWSGIVLVVDEGARNSSSWRSEALNMSWLHNWVGPETIDILYVPVTDGLCKFDLRPFGLRGARTDTRPMLRWARQGLVPSVLRALVTETLRCDATPPFLLVLCFATVSGVLYLSSTVQRVYLCL